MTLTSEVVKVAYAGTGAQTVFPITFEFWGLDDLEVLLTTAGVDEIWTRGTQFTITGGDGEVGTLTVIVAPTDYTPANGTTLTIKSNLASTQPTEIPIGGDLPSASLEQQLDQIVRQGQQRDEDVLRSLRFPLSDSSSLSAELPTSALRANKVLAFDGSGVPSVIVQNDQSATSVTTTGSVTSRLLADRFGDGSVNVLDGFGGDVATDETIAFQGAMDEAEANGVASGGSCVLFAPAKVWTMGQIIWKDRVHIRGDGVSTTAFVAQDGLNDHFFVTPDFATLTGTDVCLPSEGVISNIGLSNCRIDGNKANQTAGHAIAMIAKNPHFKDVVIQNAKEAGLYSELGQQCPVNSWDRIAAGNIDDLRIIACDGYGWHNRGPHDVFINMMKSYLNGLHGVFVENDGAGYNPTVDFNHLHSYANGQRGVHVKNTTFKGAFGRFENNDGAGLYLEGAQDCQIAVASILDNCKVTDDVQLYVDPTSHHLGISNLQSRRIGRSAAGSMRILADNCHINGTLQGDLTGGGNSAGVGLDVADTAQFNEISVTVQGFLGTGGIGVRTGNTNGINHNNIKVTLQNCDTGWNNVNAGIGNQYRITGTLDAADTKFSGAGPAVALANREFWEVHIRDSAGGYKTSKNSIRSADAIDLTLTTAQDIVVTHDLIAQPVTRHVYARVEYSGSDVTKDVQFIDVRAVSATTVTIRVKLSVAGTGTATLLTDVWL